MGGMRSGASTTECLLTAYAARSEYREFWQADEVIELGSDITEQKLAFGAEEATSQASSMRDLIQQLTGESLTTSAAPPCPAPAPGVDPLCARSAASERSPGIAPLVRV